MDIGRRDDDPVELVADPDDAIERMFRFLDLLLPADDVEDLVLVQLWKVTADRNDTDRIIVIDTLAGLAEFFVCIGRLLGP
jgi:hypothetical protein